MIRTVGMSKAICLFTGPPNDVRFYPRMAGTLPYLFSLNYVFNVITPKTSNPLPPTDQPVTGQF